MRLSPSMASHSEGVVMYPGTEVLIKLSAVEVQQALQLIKDKIVDKYFQVPCKLSLISKIGPAP
jgi:hypothetical protein